MPMEQPERKHGFVFSGVGWSQPRVVPKEGQARGVQVDLDPGMLSIRFPSEVNLTGDVAATLDALLPMLEQKSDTSWRDKIAGWMDDWWETLHDRAMVEADPVNPQRVFTELSPKLPGNVILTSDSGSSISGRSV
jgi:pyruvate dehydrogenase (quinone)